MYAGSLYYTFFIYGNNNICGRFSYVFYCVFVTNVLQIVHGKRDGCVHCFSLEEQ